MDAAALQRFHANPDAELKRFGISDSAAKIIKSKDAPAIHKAIKTNFGANAAADTVNVVVVVL
ncbi:hypothetical protein DMY87_02260 [Rhizobium wuzhouense]|uniref:DUF3606 domain-containing protein n=2 Tax=Rhizobium/Agrobacterium group TaxID=227290 RepID=A0ABX5NVL7_9HYPH|nr:hypothetical protein DMY87_02260 [Rhizobium wuzhouense]